MFIHYLKIAFRNMWKYKTQSFVGIFGLAFGLACFVPALYWLRYETSYDRFYPGAAHIYRIYAIDKQSGKVIEMVPEPLVWLLREQFPATEASAGFYPETNTFSAEGMPYIRLRTLLTDNPFFGVFPQEFVSGDAVHPLESMYNIVLTESVAMRMFGDAEKAVGQQMQSLYYFFYPPYTVTAVVKDPPPGTNLPFDAIIYYSLFPGNATGDFVKTFWNLYNTVAYVKLHPRTDVDALAEQLRDYTSRLGVNTNIELRMLPVGDVHYRLTSDMPFTLNFIRLFVASGILLLFSAIFNFLSLYLDLFRQRNREFRLRTVHGATGGLLIVQMLFELSCSILPALLLACSFVVIVSPLFSGLLGMAMETSQLTPLFVVCGAGVALLMLLGFILFWRLSRFAGRPRSEIQTIRQSALQRMTVILQLSVCVVFIVAALVVMLQIRFMNRKDIGFDRSGIVQLSGLLPRIKKSVRTDLIRELKAIPQILDVSTSNFEPQHNVNNDEIVTLVEWPGKAPLEKPAFNVISTDSRFAETFGLNMITGKWMDEGGVNQLVLNEEAIRVMGLGEPTGTVIRMSVFMDDANYREEYTIVGVVKDFHTLSLRNRIKPTIFRQSDSQGEVVTDNILYIRVVAGREQEAIQRINAILPDIDATMEGVRLTPVDELYDRLNQSEQAGLKMFSALATVCLLISLFGVYAVATAAASRRRKEIAIRKVAGAAVGDIIRMFLYEYTLQVIIAGAIALPVAYLAMNHWLQGYAYRTDIPWQLLAGALAGVITVVLFTVFGQTLKAANSNPAEVVKNG
jgi:putative ABC transport system permease protein